MIVEIASICDAATANGAGGRLNILGSFDRIFSQFPLVIPQCAAAFRIRYQRAESGVHKLALSIEDVCGHLYALEAPQAGQGTADEMKN